jgi:hypothetical protein
MAVTIKTTIGLQTLVAFLGKATINEPLPGGNCFSFYDGPACINMRCENARVAFENFCRDGMVKVELFGDGKFAYVVDDRIPDEFKTSDICGICVPGSVRDEVEKWIG